MTHTESIIDCITITCLALVWAPDAVSHITHTHHSNTPPAACPSCDALPSAPPRASGFSVPCRFFPFDPFLDFSKKNSKIDEISLFYLPRGVVNSSHVQEKEPKTACLLGGGEKWWGNVFWAGAAASLLMKSHRVVQK